MNTITKINDTIALWLTHIIGTMWCAYGFALLTLISLPEAIHGGVSTLIQWIAQTFLQLVLLSVIMVGQSIQSQKSEDRDIEDHEMIMTEFNEIKEMHTELTELMQKLYNETV